MSQHRDSHIDLCAGYALGGLSEADRRELESHLAGGCPECERALADFGAATVALAASAPQVAPPAHLKARVMEAVRVEARPASQAAPARVTDEPRRVIDLPRRPSFWSWGLAAAAAALAIATAISWNAASNLRGELAANRRQLAELEQRLTDERGWAAVLSAPQAKVVTLAPTPDGSPELVARATYDPESRRAVIVFEHFTAPAGRDYELWAIRGATPAPASLGLIKAGANGRAVMRLEDVGDPATLGAFAVSLEPEGGAPTPTAPSGPVVMLGKLSG